MRGRICGRLFYEQQWWWVVDGSEMGPLNGDTGVKEVEWRKTRSTWPRPLPWTRTAIRTRFSRGVCDYDCDCDCELWSEQSRAEHTPFRFFLFLQIFFFSSPAGIIKYKRLFVFSSLLFSFCLFRISLQDYVCMSCVNTIQCNT